MMRKSVFTEVGGFDEAIKVAFNDIDLCLRVREKGYTVIYTPYAALYHLESATRFCLTIGGSCLYYTCARVVSWEIAEKGGGLCIGTN